MFNVTVGLVPMPPFLFHCFLTLNCEGKPGTNFETVSTILSSVGAAVTPVPFVNYKDLHQKFQDGMLDMGGTYFRSVKTMTKMAAYKHDVIPVADAHVILGYPSSRYYGRKGFGPLSGSIFQIVSYEVILSALLTSATFYVLNNLLSIPAIKRNVLISGPLMLIISQYYSKLCMSFASKLITLQIALPPVNQPITTIDELSKCLNSKECCFAYSSNITYRNKFQFRKFLLYVTGNPSKDIMRQNTQLAKAIKSAHIIDVDAKTIVDLAIKASILITSCYPILPFLAPNIDVMDKLGVNGMIKWVDFTDSNPALPCKTFCYVINSHQNKSQRKQVLEALTSGTISNLYSRIFKRGIDEVVYRIQRQIIIIKKQAKKLNSNDNKNDHNNDYELYHNLVTSKDSWRTATSVDHLWNTLGPVLLLIVVSIICLLVEIVVWKLSLHNNKRSSTNPSNCFRDQSIVLTPITELHSTDEYFKRYNIYLKQLDIPADEQSEELFRRAILNHFSALKMMENLARLRQTAIHSKFHCKKPTSSIYRH